MPSSHRPVCTTEQVVPRRDQYCCSQGQSRGFLTVALAEACSCMRTLMFSLIRSRLRMRSRRQWAAALILPLALACESSSFKPEPIIDSPELYWDLELNHYAVTLSTTTPYNTLQLVATPRNYRGDPLTGLPAPQYVSGNLEKVDVTP